MRVVGIAHRYDIVSKIFTISILEKNILFSTAAGIEPARAEPTGFQDQLLNHSDTLSYTIRGVKDTIIVGIEPTWHNAKRS
jgi:hypothetical protein